MKMDGLKVTCPSCRQKVQIARTRNCAICSVYLCVGCRRRHSTEICTHLRLLLEPCIPSPVEEEAWANA